MNKKLLGLSIAGALICVSSVACADKTAAANVDNTVKSSGNAAIQTLGLAAELEALGRANKDAILLAAAMRLKQSVSVEMVEQGKTSEGGKGQEGTKAAASPELAALAREFAGENEALQAVVAMASEGSASRGRTDGAVDGHTDRVLPNSTDNYRITFTGNEEAEIQIIGDEDTDLDLHVYDERGNLICEDVETDDYPYCSWTPSWTGEFTVKISNLGDVYNQYELYTN